MTYLALRDLLDIAVKTGKPRVTKVGHIKHAEPYAPAIDFYKPLREGIARIHKAGKSKSALQGLLAGISDPRKKANYPGAVSGYGNWWGNKLFVWFNPPKGKYPKSGFEVSVNPELGLEFGGQRHVIKLYMNVVELDQARADLVVALMAHVLGPLVPGTVAMSVLDMRRSKLVSATGNSAKLMPTVDSVLADIAAIWPSV